MTQIKEWVITFREKAKELGRTSNKGWTNTFMTEGLVFTVC